MDTVVDPEFQGGLRPPLNPTIFGEDSGGIMVKGKKSTVSWTSARWCRQLFMVAIVVGGCRGAGLYAIGDCVIPAGTSSPEKIVRIVAVEGTGYKTFSHFLSNGKLILGEDYIGHPRAELERGYSKIECPRTEGTFSRDRYLNEKGTQPESVGRRLTVTTGVQVRVPSDRRAAALNALCARRCVPHT